MTRENPDTAPQTTPAATSAATGDDFQGPPPLVERKPFGQIFGTNSSVPFVIISCNELHRQYGLGERGIQLVQVILPEKTSHLSCHHPTNWMRRMDWAKVENQEESEKGTENTGLHKTQDSASPLLLGSWSAQASLISGT